ncbi:LysM peptidoglycan-binding domain-containing protein, partial [Lactonifactor longoviformis]
MDIHIVAPGDTIASIAARYGVSPSRLSYDNQLNEQTHLVVGQALLVLRPELVHEVFPGDTPSSISSQYGISALELLRNNPFLSNQPYLVPGEYLIIRYEGGKTGSMETDGYAYPFINRPLLRQTLPYLTALSIFSYGFTPEGELIPVDDGPLISMAREFDTRCVLVLTPFSASGSFDNNLVTLVTNNLEVQNRVIENLLQTVSQKPYQEVDVDFEFIRAEDRIPYVEFVRNLTRRMNAVGVMVSVALAPKVSADQPGLLYEGIDYRLLGEAANTVLLMTYEWGYT